MVGFPKADVGPTSLWIPYSRVNYTRENEERGSAIILIRNSTGQQYYLISKFDKKPKKEKKAQKRDGM